MEFGQKLQELRKQKGLTQDELAQDLFVSRTAISKWESGRGYPNIESLKAIAKYFGISIDDLLSSNEVLVIAEKDDQKKTDRFRNVVFGGVDLSAAMLLFLPIFSQKADGEVWAVSLIHMYQYSAWLRSIDLALVFAIVALGVVALCMQGCNQSAWVQCKRVASLGLNLVATMYFALRLQPYAAVLLLVFLMIKCLVVIKWK